MQVLTALRFHSHANIMMIGLCDMMQRINVKYNSVSEFFLEVWYHNINIINDLRYKSCDLCGMMLLFVSGSNFGVEICARA